MGVSQSQGPFLSRTSPWKDPTEARQKSFLALSELTLEQAKQVSPGVWH